MSRVLKFNPALKALHLLYGKREDKKCGDCEFFITFHQGSKWFKCKKTTMRFSLDWRKNYIACGKFKEREDDEKS